MKSINKRLTHTAVVVIVYIWKKCFSSRLHILHLQQSGACYKYSNKWFTDR